MDVILQICATILICVITLALVVWTAGALYYDVGRASRMARAVVLLWVGSVVVGFVIWQPPWKPFLAFLVIFGLFLVWWSSQKPSSLRRTQFSVANDVYLYRLTAEGNEIANLASRENFGDYIPLVIVRTKHPTVTKKTGEISEKKTGYLDNATLVDKFVASRFLKNKFRGKMVANTRADPASFGSPHPASR